MTGHNYQSRSPVPNPYLQNRNNNSSLSEKVSLRMNRQIDRDWERGVVRYPDPAFEVIDSRFARYVIGNCAV